MLSNLVCLRPDISKIIFFQFEMNEINFNKQAYAIFWNIYRKSTFICSYL